MTAPIPVYKNATIAGGRRTERGACYLTPTKEVRNIIVYLFIHYAKKYEIRLLTLVIMSNHVHWVADDPNGAYPKFLAALHSRLTEVLNDHHDRTGPMWANCKPQRTRLLDDKTIEEKTLYAATNGSWHGIETYSRNWDGFVFSPEDIGRAITATCPDYLLDNYNSFPDQHSYKVPKPACYKGMTDAQARSRFRAKRRARELAIARERKKPPLTTARALEAGPDHIPAPANDPRDVHNKLFDGATEDVVESAFLALDQFRRAYTTARKEFTSGRRNVRWPRGTWAMLSLHNCPCH